MKSMVRFVNVCCLSASAMAAAQSTPSTGKPDLKAAVLYVAPAGNDEYSGTMEKPFATVEKAKNAARERMNTGREPIRVLLREGTYYLNQPLELGPQDSGTAAAPVTYAAYPGERVTLSGGRRLECSWRAYTNGIMMCELPEVKAGKLGFSQLFINGKRQVRARYPNYDNSHPGKSGYIYPAKKGRILAGMVDPQPGPNDDMVYTGVGARGILFDPASFTQKRWAKPQEAVLHIFRGGYWGNLQWRIKAIDYEQRAIWFGDGGHQMGAKWDPDPAAINSSCRFFIENVFEELDAPGEWYLDTAAGTLYFMPPPGLKLRRAVVEVPVLESVVRIVGTQGKPVSHLTIEGFRIAHTTSTFMSTYEVPSLSDWSIHRGGAVLLQGTRGCTIRNCWLDAVGGNAVFVNQYNRDTTVSGCKITEAGDSAIAFVGSLERTTGTERAFPYECKAHDNLIHDCGVFGKQIAGVYISRAKRITASHNLIYNMPRAAICIGDGTWGGHIIEFNHFHDTVRETGDHGPFNAWGRDKYWSLTQSHLPYTKDRSVEAGRVEVDAMEPVIIRNNFFEEKPESIEGVHGPVFGIDLDDGASNYEIYNNITKNVSMKLREGAKRTIYNNIWFNSVVAPCFHVGNDYNHDRYFRNITVMSRDDVYSIIAPPARGPWLEEVDNNCFFTRSGVFTARVSELRGEKGPDRAVQKYDLEGWRRLGFDAHSVFADPLFVDPERNDFRVGPDSPALKLGFKNFEMGKWGLTDEFPAVWRENGTPGQAAEDTVSAAREATSRATPSYWQVFSNNPVLAPGPAGSWDAGALGSMTVLKAGNQFHLYYEAWGVRGNASADYNSLQIGHATSPDGLHWTKDPANPVLPKGAGNAWDRDGTWDPFVLHEDGVFKMWYGGGMDQHCDWGYAVSTDGVHFEKKGQISHLGGVEDDHVVHDKTTGRYFMYYWDRKHEPMGLFRAESRNETDFDFAHAEPIRIEGVNARTKYKFTHVIQNDGQWEMFFGKFVRPGCKGCSTGLATSPDGLHWTAKNTNLLVGIDGEVLKAADNVWMLFYGRDGLFDQAGQDIRLAVFKGSLNDLAGEDGK